MSVDNPRPVDPKFNPTKRKHLVAALKGLGAVAIVGAIGTAGAVIDREFVSKIFDPVFAELRASKIAVPVPTSTTLLTDSMTATFRVDGSVESGDDSIRTYTLDRGELPAGSAGKVSRGIRVETRPVGRRLKEKPTYFNLGLYDDVPAALIGDDRVQKNKGDIVFVRDQWFSLGASLLKDYNQYVDDFNEDIR